MTEIIAYIVLLIACAFLYYVTYSFPSFGKTITGPETFPRMVSHLSRHHGPVAPDQRGQEEGAGELPDSCGQIPGRISGALPRPVHLDAVIGFFVSAPIFLLACMAWFIGAKGLGNAWTIVKMVLSTAGTVGVIWYVFAVKLDVIFP